MLLRVNVRPACAAYQRLRALPCACGDSCGEDGCENGCERCGAGQRLMELGLAVQAAAAAEAKDDERVRALQDELQATRSLLVEANDKCKRAGAEVAERGALLQKAFEDALAGLRAASSSQLRDCQARHDDEVRQLRENFCSMLTRYEDQTRRFLETCDISTATNRITDSIFGLREQQAVLQRAVLQRNEAQHEEDVRKMSELVAKLSGDVDRLRSENERLKSTNHVKGTYGEALVQGLLRQHFERWAFQDTSAVGHHSDFHMTCPDTGAVVAVEVKNKAHVTGGDVDKSVRDARELRERLGARLVGYVFVSIRTRNIPKRGALGMDLNEGLPMLWYGATDEDDLRACGPELGKLVRLVHAVGAALAEKERDAVSATAFLQRARQYMEQLQKQRKIVAGMTGALATLKNNMADLLGGIDAMHRDIESTILVVRPSSSSSLPAALTATCCHVCGKEFKSLKQHLRASECGKLGDATATAGGSATPVP